MAKRKDRTEEDQSNPQKEGKITMSLQDVLGKLQEAQGFILNNAPDALDKTANVLQRVEEACRQASEYLRNIPARGTAEEAARFDAELAQTKHQLVLLRDRCHTIATGSGRLGVGGPVPAGLSPEMVTLLSTLISQVINAILARLGG